MMHHNKDDGFTLPYKVADLIAKVTANREAHRGTHEKAVAVYRQDYRDECAAIITAIDAGNPFRHGTRLEKPTEYLKDYDRALAMLKMTTAESITMAPELFQQLVCDEWEWSGRFSATNDGYSSKWKP